MINNDRSLPVVVPKLSAEMMKKIIEKCINDPLYFYKNAVRWNERNRK